MYPLSRDSTGTYIKKKSSAVNINKKNKNGNTSKSSIFKHKKNNSISSSIYTQKSTQDNKNSIKEKKNCIYSAKNNNRNGKYLKNNNSIIIPEYAIKLENIKSRVSNLLNVYSLIALRSLNNNMNNNNEKIIENNNKNS